MHGSWNTPVGENFDFTSVPQAGSAIVLGRPSSDDSWKLSPLPVMMLNGRPELNFDERRKRPVAEEFAAKAAAAHVTGLIDAAEDEPVALIEQRRRAIEATGRNCLAESAWTASLWSRRSRATRCRTREIRSGC